MIVNALIKNRAFYAKLVNFNFIRSKRINKWLGLGVFKWVVKNTFFKFFNQSIKIEKRIGLSELEALRKEMTTAEMGHLIGFVFVVDDAAVDRVEFRDGVLQTARVLEDVLDAAVADFEGLGSPQILYRTQAELLLRRVEQDVEFTVGFDPEQDTFALPWGPANFGPGAGVLARACGFSCEFIAARLVEC